MAALRWRKAATLAMIGVFAHHEPSTAHAVASSRGRLSLPGSTAYGGARARTPPATRRRAHRSSTVVLSAARSDEDSYGGADETSSDLDMEVLRRRMRRNRASTLSADDDGQVVGSAGGPEIYSPEDLASWEAETEDLHANLEYGWVLLFNAGTVEEGVYTVQDDDTTTFVLAFEDHEDATRFARQLEAEEFDLPTVSNWEMDILTEFCEADDFRIGWVPQGVMLLPPRDNYYRDDLDEFDTDVDDDERVGQAVAPSQMASRVTPELVSHLEHLFNTDCTHPFDESERQ